MRFSTGAGRSSSTARQMRSTRMEVDKSVGVGDRRSLRPWRRAREDACRRRRPRRRARPSELEGRRDGQPNSGEDKVQFVEVDVVRARAGRAGDGRSASGLRPDRCARQLRRRQPGVARAVPEQGSVPARRVPSRGRHQPQRSLRHGPVGRVLHVRQRAVGRGRARADRQRRLDRGIRGSDGPGRVRRIQRAA